MKNLIVTALRWSWYLLAVLTVLCAAMVSLGQYYFPRVGDYQQQFLDEVNARTPFGVELEQFSGEWTGLAPTLYLRKLRLYDRAEPANSLLQLPSAEVRIDLVGSLMAWAPRVRKLIVERGDIALVEDDRGRWGLAGLPARDDAGQGRFLTGLLLGVREVEFLHAGLSADFHQAEDINSANAHLRLENYQGFRRLKLDLSDEAVGSTLQILLEGHGDPREPDGFTVQAYLGVESLHSDHLKPILNRLGLDIESSVLSSQLWIERKASGVIDLRGEFSSPRLTLGRGEGQGELIFDALGTELAAKVIPGQRVDLRLDPLRLQWAGIAVDVPRLHLWRDLRDSAAPVHLAVESLDLAVLSSLGLTVEDLPDKLADALRTLQPTGSLDNVRLSLPPSGIGGFELSARLRDGKVLPWKGAPGGRGLEAYIRADASGGFAELDSSNMTLHFPKVFGHESDFVHGLGRVRWELYEEGIRVRSDLLHLSDPDGDLFGYFLLDLQKDPAREDTLSLTALLRDASALQHSAFMPLIVDRTVVKWLDSAVIGGEVTTAAFHLHTVVSPNKPPRSTDMQLLLQVENGTVQFDPRWPVVKEVRALVYVDNANVETLVQRGTLLDNQLNNALVRVARPDPGLPRRVHVGGEVQGDLGNMLRLFTETPLRETTGSLLVDWRGSGAVSGQLAFDLPLSTDLGADAVTMVAIAADLDGAAIEIPKLRLQIENLRGPLRYELSAGLQSSGLRGELWGDEIDVRIASITPLQVSSPLRLDISGEVSMRPLAAWLQEPLLTFVDGSSRAELQLVVGTARTEIQARSDLKGVRIDAPLPFGKAADAALDLHLSYSDSPVGTALDISFADLAATAIRIDGGGKLRAGVLLEPGTRQPVPPVSGVHLGGPLASLSLEEWIPTVQRYFDAAASRQYTGIGFGADLQLGELSASELALYDVSLTIRSENDGTRFNLGHTGLIGSVLMPADIDAPLQIHLRELQLDALWPEEEGAGGDDALPQTLTGVELPHANVIIDSMLKGEANFGSWSFEMVPLDEGLVLRNLEGELRGIEISGRGKTQGASLAWNWEGPRVVSGFDGVLASDDIARVFEAWDLPTPVEARRSSIEVALQWPGAPQDFSIQDVSGWSSLGVRDGRLLDVGNNPAMRFVGVFNFNEILRRLRFDFQDFFKQGLTFDHFNGELVFAAGRVETRDAIELKGPSTRIRLAGTADLHDNTINAELVATLPLSSNLPWVAAIAGGPAMAAGVYVASRLFENEMGRLSSAVYSLTGSLDAPDLKLDHVFDTREDADAAAGSVAEVAPEDESETAGSREQSTVSPDAS